MRRERFSRGEEALQVAALRRGDGVQAVADRVKDSHSATRVAYILPALPPDTHITRSSLSVNGSVTRCDVSCDVM